MRPCARKSRGNRVSALTRQTGTAMIQVREDKTGILFWITVKPRSKKNGVFIAHDDTVIVQVTAAPVEGKANEACCKVLAQVLGISKSSISIRTGETSTKKLVHCRNIFAEEVRLRLDSKK